MKKIVFITILASFVLISPVFAQEGQVNNKEGKVNNSGTTVKLNDPLGYNGAADAPQKLIGRVINAALGVVGSFALLMFIYGGFMWMLSGGKEEMINKGKSTLIWAALGLVVIFMSYAIVKFVISSATTPGS